MNNENESVDSKEFNFHPENELNSDKSAWDANVCCANDDILNQNVEYKTSIGASRSRRKNEGAGVSRLEVNFNCKKYLTTHLFKPRH